MGLIVFIVAIILTAILLPIGIIWGLVEAFVEKGFKGGLTRLNKYFFDIAISIDQLGNVICKELFNDALILHTSESRFGNPDETISSVVGKNKRAGTLTKTGKILSFILDTLDKNHSLKSIEDDESNNKE